jgi:hypothetical protein
MCTIAEMHCRIHYHAFIYLGSDRDYNWRCVTCGILLDPLCNTTYYWHGICGWYLSIKKDTSALASKKQAPYFAK